MLTLRKIAVTGGVSAGKSSVCRLLQNFGAHVVDADAIVHSLLSPQTPLGEKVIELLGDGLVVNGQFDRGRIAAKVFNNPKQLASLEQLLHPLVQQEIDAAFARVAAEGKATLFVAEVPLLFEARLNNHYDAVVAVIAQEELCEARFQAKGLGADYRHRATRQLPQQTKAQQADFIIQNNQSPEVLKEAVAALYPQLLRVKKRRV